jgi:hypothetical protein
LHIDYFAVIFDFERDTFKRNIFHHLDLSQRSSVGTANKQKVSGQIPDPLKKLCQKAGIDMVIAQFAMDIQRIQRFSAGNSANSLFFQICAREIRTVSAR